MHVALKLSCENHRIKHAERVWKCFLNISKLYLFMTTAQQSGRLCRVKCTFKINFKSLLHAIKRNIIWHVLCEHCNICCVSLGRAHWPSATEAHVPEVLVRSPPDMGSCGNHGNQGRGERGGVPLVATGE